MVVIIFILPQGPFGSLRIAFTLQAMYVAQTILALPYVVALTAAAIQGVGPGVVDQARALGASRVQLARLALREAKIGVIAAIIAALAAIVSEVGAIIIVGGNFQGRTESLASALLAEFTFTPNDPRETAIALLLLTVVIVLVGSLTVLQQRTGQLRLRFRDAWSIHLVLDEFKVAVPLIWHGDPYLMQIIGFTLQVAAIATSASLIGIRSGCRWAWAASRPPRAARAANSSLGVPPVLVGSVLFLFFAGPRRAERCT